jgi:HPt (histidine-containing phosphotransfer) domain-containing protein
VEAARREKNQDDITPKKDLAELKKYFVIDAQDAINTLEKMYTKIDSLDDTEIDLYSVTVHGIKSALANIDEKRLSNVAYDLEKASKARNIGIMTEKTPVFLDELKSLVEKNQPEKTNAPASHDEMLYLYEKLSEFKAAGETYNVRAAEAVLNELKQKKWPLEINTAIYDISVNLLRGEFEMAVSNAEKLISTPGNSNLQEA